MDKYPENIEASIRKIGSEKFDSALLSFATSLSKNGKYVNYFVARPYKAEGFYNIHYRAFKDGKEIADSLLSMNDDSESFFNYLLYEQDVNDEYQLGAKFIPFPDAQ